MRAKEKIKIIRKLLQNETQSEPAYILYAIDSLIDARSMSYAFTAQSVAEMMLKVASEGVVQPGDRK